MKDIKEFIDFGEMWLEELVELSYLFDFQQLYLETQKVIKEANFGDPFKNDLGSIPKLSRESIIENGRKVREKLLKEPNINSLKKKYSIINRDTFKVKFHNFKNEVPGLEDAFNGDYDMAFFTFSTIVPHSYH